MRSTYTGFYSTSDEVLKEIWEADSTLFVFDTNCLLNLYRCEDHTREEILKVMNAVSSRTWIPFQVGFEYQRNRRTVIAESIASLRKIQEGLHRIYNDNILSHGSVKKHLYNSLNNEVTALQLQLKEPIEAFINEKITPRIESKLRISEHDFIRDQIDSIINNNVGPIPTQQFIDEINKEGESRYEKKSHQALKMHLKRTFLSFRGYISKINLVIYICGKKSSPRQKRITLKTLFSYVMIQKKIGGMYTLAKHTALWKRLRQKYAKNLALKTSN